jgi:hypothetical protein
MPYRLLAVSIIGVALVALSTAADDKKDEFKPSKDEKAVIDLTNAERKRPTCRR